LLQQQRLLQRLEAIATSLAHSGHGLALLGVGSVGTELNRLDQYSDLDFFAIVEPGYKATFIENLAWLEAVCPIAYAFQNSRDGQKVLFTDGIFVEFAVFVPAELENIPHDEGRVVWQKDGFDATALRAPAPQPEQHPREFYLGEALTNLYVGLLRLHRGEHLSAMRFIQVYAVNNLLELSADIERPMMPASRDRYAPERRYEQRFPETAPHLSSFIQGYDRSDASARAILGFLEGHFPVNAAIKQRILELCE
jgi:lincosamide nucleotidyltransferase B/F